MTLNRMALIALSVTAFFPVAGWARQAPSSPPESLETRIWLDRGVDPVFESGDQARVYYRASADAHLLVFHIDTDGVLRLLFPGGADQAARARGGRDYRLLFPDSDEWVIDESPGVGYFFVLASGRPFSFDRLSTIPVAGGWDSSLDRNRIRADPYVVIDDFRQVLLPEATEADYAIDFTAYHVDQPYSYPRFLCYQCHVEQPFEDWNPYMQTCLDVRVVIYNDPYYYPATRYRGDQILYARPPQPGLPQFAFTRRFLGEAGTPIVQSRTAVGRPASDRFFEPGGGLAGPDLLRNVDQGRANGQGPPVGQAGDQAPPASLRAPESRIPSSALPVVPRRAPGADRPTLERRGRPDGAPDSR